MKEVYSYLQSNQKGLIFDEEVSSEDELKRIARRRRVYPSNVLEHVDDVDEPEYDIVFEDEDLSIE